MTTQKSKQQTIRHRKQMEAGAKIVAPQKKKAKRKLTDTEVQTNLQKWSDVIKNHVFADSETAERAAEQAGERIVEAMQGGNEQSFVPQPVEHMISIDEIESPESDMFDPKIQRREAYIESIKKLLDPQLLKAKDLHQVHKLLLKMSHWRMNRAQKKAIKEVVKAGER